MPRGEAPAVVPGAVVFVGTDAGVFRVSADAAATGAAGPWLADLGSVRCLAEDAGGGTLVAGFGMRGSGLRRTRDRGVSWEGVPGWPDDRQAWSAVLREDGALWVGSQPADLWIGRIDRIGRIASIDGRGDGAWQTSRSLRDLPERARWDFIVPPYEAHLLHVAECPERRGRWAAAVEQGGILESLDDGATWTQISPLWDAHQVAFAREGSLVAATGGGLFRRTAAGSEWTSCRVAGYVTGLCRDDAGALFAAVGDAEDDGGALRVSEDDGRAWRPFGPPDVPPPGHGVHALAAVPGRPGTLVHGAGADVWLVTADSARRLASGLPVVRRVLVSVRGD